MSGSDDGANASENCTYAICSNGTDARSAQVLAPRQKCQESITSPARSAPTAASTSRPAEIVGTAPSGLNSTAILVCASASMAAQRRIEAALSEPSPVWNTVRTHSARTVAAASVSFAAKDSVLSWSSVMTRASSS